MLRRTKLIGISAANESIFAIYARKEKALLDVLRNVLSLLENKIKKKKKKKKKKRKNEKEICHCPMNGRKSLIHS